MRLLRRRVGKTERLRTRNEKIKNLKINSLEDKLTNRTRRYLHI